MKLFEPIIINNVEFKNRIVMAAMGIGTFALIDESKQDRVIAYYAERAKGGVGGIIVGAAPPGFFVEDGDPAHGERISRYLESMQRLVRTVQGYGVKIGIQLWHINQHPSLALWPTHQEWAAPSSRVEPDPQKLRYAPAGKVMRELTVSEIKAIIATFGEAAVGVKKTGADFVELHAAHGHLPNQFFSPIDNQRRDSYGGDLNGRMKFGLECIRSMRNAVGAEYPIFLRMGAQEDRDGGSPLEENMTYAMELEKAGADCLDISVSISETLPYVSYVSPTGKQPMGTYASLAGSIKEKVNIPVIAVGRINTAEVAEDILTRQQADLVAIGRQMICDPFWPEKVAAGRMEEIIACDSCNANCWDLEQRLEKDAFLCRRNERPGEERESLFPG